MKRLLRSLLVFGVLAAIAAGYLQVRNQQEAYQWKPLPNVGEVRLFAVTHGLKHEINFPRTSWSQRLKNAWQARSLRSLSPSHGSVYSRSASSLSAGSQPSITIWLETRTPSGASVSLQDSELTLPDGQLFHTGSSSGSGGGPTYLNSVSYPVVPYYSKTLHFATTINNQRCEFDFPNPAFRADLPVWTPQPLPQTQKRGTVELTLRALKLEPGYSRYGAGDWRMEPQWTVAMDGAEATRCYGVRATYEDPGGNSAWQIGLLSAPAWKIHATATRTNRFPFADGEVHWLGTLDRQQAPADENCVVFPLDAVPQTSEFKLAGVFGAGQYDIKDGAVTPTGPPIKLDQTKQSRTDWDQQKKTMHLTLEHPAFIISADFNGDIAVFRNAQGAPSEIRDEWSAGGPFGHLVIYPLPEHPVRFGIADKAPLTFEFVVRPPAMPDARAVQSKP